MLKGSIYITYDMNLCLANLNNCKTIVIADEVDMYNIPGKIGGSLLVPPYQALMAVIDGDEEKFRNEYLQYLSVDPTVNKFINIILQALLAGTNIIFLMDREGPTKFDMVLKEYFMISYGIILGDDSTQFQYDINYIPVIFNKLYTEDDFTPQSYLENFPLDIPFDPFIVNKLIYDMQFLGIPFTDHNHAHSYFKKLSRIMQNGGIIQNVVKRIG